MLLDATHGKSAYIKPLPLGCQLENTDSFLRCLPYGKTLYPFQVETVKKSLSFLSSTPTHSAYVASEMGLGKSITSLVTASFLNLHSVLIVCPAIMRRVWEKEITTWVSTVETISVIESSSDITAEVFDSRFIIISYSLISDDEIAHLFSHRFFDLIIFDEAHYLKNSRAKRTKVCLKEIFPASKYHLLLSGTPMTKSVTDLYPTFHTIMPSVFPRFTDFVTRYSFMRQTPWATEYYGVKNPEELSKLMRDSFYIRYKKQDVLSELPEITYQNITLSEEYSVKLGSTHYETIYLETQTLMQALIDGKGKVLSHALAEHRRLQGVSKVPAVSEFASDLLDQDIPIAIFCWHKDVLEALRQKLISHKPQIITGETDAKKRTDAVESFQSGETNLILCTIGAAGVGITLTRANHVLLAEISYSPADNSQALSRCHRIGTKGNVTAYTFTVRESLDDDVTRIVMRKTKDFGLVCDAGEKAES